MLQLCHREVRSEWGNHGGRVAHLALGCNVRVLRGANLYGSRTWPLAARMIRTVNFETTGGLESSDWVHWLRLVWPGGPSFGVV